MTENTTTRLPDVWVIPQQAINEWIALDSATVLNVEITRQTIDHLFFALVRLGEAQEKFHGCLIAYSNGDTSSANSRLIESQTALIEGQNRLRQFMTDIMLSATRGAA